MKKGLPGQETRTKHFPNFKIGKAHFFMVHFWVLMI